MRLLLFAAALAALFEAVFRLSPPLRPVRRHLRAILLLFWLVVCAIHFGGVWGVAPSLYHNGVPRFASDAATYQAQATLVADDLRAGSTRALLDSQIFNYPRVLGLIYVLVGNEPLAGGLFQAVFFLTSIIAVFLVGRAIFDERVGLAAAWMTACWPSLLMYGTQTMRWASTTAGLHLVVLAGILTVSRVPLHRVVLTGLVGYSFLLGDQPYLARVVYVSFTAYAAWLAVHAIGEGRWRMPLLRVIVLGLVCYVAYGATWMQFFQSRPIPTAAPSLDARFILPITAEMPSRTCYLPSVLGGASKGLVEPRAATPWNAGAPPRPAPGPVEARLDSAILPVLAARANFIAAQDELARDGIVDATALKGGLLYTFRDFVANLPTALYWAVFAPTPVSLIEAGNGASGLRRYATAEVLLYYSVLPLVVLGMARAFRRGTEARSHLFLIVFLSALSYVLFGTVTMNGGTLQRFRVPFFLVHLVFAAAALTPWLTPRPSGAPGGPPVRP
ncbi:MAG: hypothetical protein AB7H88_04050 [Vicinamibacterales bacterium]